MKRCSCPERVADYSMPKPLPTIGPIQRLLADDFARRLVNRYAGYEDHEHISVLASVRELRALCAVAMRRGRSQKRRPK